MRWSRFRSTLPSTIGSAWNSPARLQGEAPHQLAAADVEEATVADGEAPQAIGPEGARAGPGRSRHADPEQRGKRPHAAASPVGTRPSVEVSIRSVQAWRCWPSQAAKASAVGGSGASATTASTRTLAHCAEKMADETPSAITAMPRGASTWQASWYSPGCSGSLASPKMRDSNRIGLHRD